MTFEEALDWDTVVEALADSRPCGSPAPSTATTPSPTGGWSARSSAGSAARASGQFFADEVAGPLGLDFWIGLPEEQHRPGRRR